MQPPFSPPNGPPSIVHLSGHRLSPPILRALYAATRPLVDFPFETHYPPTEHLCRGTEKISVD